jgi:hypothetical protein
MQPSRGVKASEHGCRLGALEAAIADEAADDRAILLLDKGLIVLLVGP